MATHDGSEFQRYRRKGNLAQMRPYREGEDLSGVSVSAEDTPELGGMIARNPENERDQWYVGKDYFAANFYPEPVTDD